MPPRSSAGFPALKVTYYRRMKQNGVYPVTVAWGERPKPLGTIKTVTVRLLGGGAQIVPSEQALDATRPDVKATFFVTPLAYGWLRAQRLEILVQGRKVQEVPLASRVTCQCWAGVWFILAFVLPALLIWLQTLEPTAIAEGFGNHVPALPAIVAEQAPVAPEYWNKFWESAGDVATKAMLFNRQNLLAFPVFIGFLLLSLWSLFIHRDKTKRRWSEPIAIPTGADD